MNSSYLYPELSKSIVDAFYEVCKALPSGMLEEVYQNALCIELRRKGKDVFEQKQLTVKYKGIEVGYFKADMVVDDKIIVELKAVDSLTSKHTAQLINYLSITGVKIGYLTSVPIAVFNAFQSQPLLIKSCPTSKKS